MEPYPLHRVALVAMGPSAAAFANSIYYRELEPKKGHTEVWTLNYGYHVWKHDVLFNMRDLVHERQHNPAGDFIEPYKDHPVPVITSRYVKEIKNCYEFPFETMFKTFGSQYFSCGNSYIVAFAIMCLELAPDGDKELHIFGADFNYPDKNMYEAGRCNLEYWIGRAEERGIKVRVPTASSLLDLYQRVHGHKGLVGNGVMYGMQDMVPEFDTEVTTHLQLREWKSNGPD